MKSSALGYRNREREGANMLPRGFVLVTAIEVSSPAPWFRPAAHGSIVLRRISASNHTASNFAFWQLHEPANQRVACFRKKKSSLPKRPLCSFMISKHRVALHFGCGPRHCILREGGPIRIHRRWSAADLSKIPLDHDSLTSRCILPARRDSSIMCAP